VKALLYYPSIPRYLVAGRLGKRYPSKALPLKLKTMPELEPKPGWRRVKVRLSGICGSDLALLYGKNSPRLSPFFSFPAVLGHEILGEVEGVKVAVNPLLSCRERGLEPCAACRQGEDGLCLTFGEGDLAPGMLGFCRDLPGGWGEAVVARNERLYPIADSVPDVRAVLAEPLAVVLRGLKPALARLPRTLLVIGAGTIGLLSIQALRLLGYAGELHVAARHPFQAELARTMGADRVHLSAWEAAKEVGAKPYRALIGPPAWRGGFEVVVDAAGSAASLEQASWLTKEGGTLLLLGAPGSIRHDFSPYWFGELTLVGSYTYAAADFKQAVDLLAEAKGLERMVTRRFPLEAWPQALATLQRRRAVKVVFAPDAD
jgi:threonine dehydrogenase-like Zn-dependent dehydrogenase